MEHIPLADPEESAQVEAQQLSRYIRFPAEVLEPYFTNGW